MVQENTVGGGTRGAGGMNRGHRSKGTVRIVISTYLVHTTRGVPSEHVELTHLSVTGLVSASEVWHIPPPDRATAVRRVVTTQTRPTRGGGGKDRDEIK